MAAKQKAQEIIDNNAVGRRIYRSDTPLRTYSDYFHTAVFSKSYCPYCKATKSLLSEQGAKAFIIELDQVGA
jgi:glutaredoxin 3